MLEFFFGLIVGICAGGCLMAVFAVASCHDCQEHGPSRGE